MVNEAPSLQYDTKQGIAANEGGLSLLTEIRGMRADIERLESHCQKLESHRQSHLDLRQRAISTWVRDALHKDDTRRFNKSIIHGGDVRSDAIVVTERYEKSSTEWQSFRTLYGLTPDNVNDLDQHKCFKSLQALDRAASILLKDARTGLPDPVMRIKREDLVNLLLEGSYEEAETMSRLSSKQRPTNRRNSAFQGP
ncbi:uncharacterized protein PGRI_066130 [Penicillium griseofulvum]|uniref:Uncharacterized protein n=1 Tax=Penicillium patulum TaxID=5078 RepID=A0A135LQ08_PENPA|nr:uncharacterized protein PGRI_066130 [Penicillium griseofulvum]KXG51041.1 hypothetical protein PGRI_066130 [Penicillium griseofulvum]